MNVKVQKVRVIRRDECVVFLKTTAAVMTSRHHAERQRLAREIVCAAQGALGRAIRPVSGVNNSPGLWTERCP